MNNIKSFLFWLLYRPISYYKIIRLWYKKILNPKNKSGLVVKIPLLAKMKYNYLGFSDLEYVIFDLAHNDYKKYISTWERLRLEKVNGRFAYFLGEKVMFERMFGKFVNVPHIHCWVKSGKFINLDNNINEISITDIIKNEIKIIAKPTRSLGGGKHIHELSYENEKFFIDSVEFIEKDFISQCRKLEEYIFTKKISSHDYSKTIFPHSSNTIRIVSVMDNEKNAADIILAFHRFGTSRSKFVDNINSGGLFSLVNIETGKLGNAKSLFDINDINKVYSTHPDTGAPIKDVCIPKWNDIKDNLKKVHKCFPYYQFFAWDATLDEEGRLWILEINRGSDLEIQEFCPLKNEKFGLWMKKRGLL